MGSTCTYFMLNELYIPLNTLRWTNNRFFFIITPWKWLFCKLQVYCQCQVCDLICQRNLLHIAFSFFVQQVLSLSCIPAPLPAGGSVTVRRAWMTQHSEVTTWVTSALARVRTHTHKLWLTCQSLRSFYLQKCVCIYSEKQKNVGAAPRIGLHDDMCALSLG